MNLLESFKIALKALTANKARAVLTMLGVIIGVASVILLVSIGSGVGDEITGQLEGLGSNLIYAMPGNYEEMLSGGGMGSGGGAAMGGPSASFSIDDVEAVSSRIKEKGVAVPLVQGSASLAAGNKTMNVSMRASDGHGREVFDISLAEGRAYNQSETVGAARVVVAGSEVIKQLFPSRDPIGQEMKINGLRFKVIGVLTTQGGGSMGSGQDTTIMMPYTTAQKLLNTQDINMIAVKVADPDDAVLVQTLIRQALRPSMGTDFSVFRQDQMLGIIDTMMSTLTYMLAGIAGISLLVGGIGIMNIMLVSVSERTREIGIRKAIGARTYDIMAQFVIEAIVLSVLGGLIGITIGLTGTFAMGSAGVPASATPWSVALAFIFSLVVGVFFGVYPAYKASKLDPIEALRYE
jgi:putative ABC transport system permease protein